MIDVPGRLRSPRIPSLLLIALATLAAFVRGVPTTNPATEPDGDSEMEEYRCACLLAEMVGVALEDG